MRSNETGKMKKYENSTNSTIEKTQHVHKNLNKERFAYVMTCLIGNEVTVHMKDGNEVKGLFHAYNCTNKNDREEKNGKGEKQEKTEKGEKQEKREIDISLNYGRVLPKNDKVSGPINKAMIIPENNYKAIIGKDIKLELKDPDEIKLKKEKFKIDADISEKKKNANNVNRELKRWICDDDDKIDESKLKLERFAEPWDQFEQNRKLYGVTTTYKEEIYTTNLDINKVPHHVKIHADKIAKELEKRGMHLDPEDADKDNPDIDEEYLFGAVRPSAKEKYNKHQKYKKEETKAKTYQGKFHPLVIKDLKEKIQSVKRENEKKYPNKPKPETREPSSSNDDTNSALNRKTNASSNAKNSTNPNTDFIGINALNLEPALPKLDEKNRSEWITFKNKVKNKSSVKKDKNAEKQEFIIAAKEFNAKLAGKMDLNKKEPPARPGKEYPPPAVISSVSNNQKNISAATADKPKLLANGSGDKKPTNNNAFTNSNSVAYSANNTVMNNPNMRPQDFFMYNCNTYNGVKNNVMVPPPNMDLYVNMPMIPESQNQVYQFADHPVYKNEGMAPVYQNMKMGEFLGNDLNSSTNSQSKDNSSDELTPFPLKIHQNKTSFSDFVSSVLKYSKKENCVECEIGFKSTYQFSYKNVLGEIPAIAPVNYMPIPPATYPNNIPAMAPPLPNGSISSNPMNCQLIPVMPPNGNNPNPYVDKPLYFNPYFPNFYPNNVINANDNSNNINTNSNTPNNVPSVNSNNIPPYMYVPESNMEANYASNKNMHMYALRNPLYHLHATNQMNFPIASCLPPNMNYPLNANAMNMINNPNMPNSNMNLPAYPADIIMMNPPKFPNANPCINQSQNQNQNQNLNINQNIGSIAPALPQPMHPQFMPPYPYPNYYNPSHDIN